MNTTTLLAPAAGAIVLLTACGSGTSTTPVTPQAASSTAPFTGPRPAPVTDGGAYLDADDQSGDGTTLVA